MIKNQFAKGLGSWAAPNLTLDAARNLIYGASKIYLDKFDNCSSGYELIQRLLSPSSHFGVSCCAEEVLNEIQDTLKELSSPINDKDSAAAGLLFVVHLELLKVSQENTILGQRQLIQLADKLGLHHDQVWDVAFSIASWADELPDSENYAHTLDALYSILNHNDHIGEYDEN